MTNYDFSTLSSSDLEELVCDLWNADLPKESPVKYKTFKEGKDKGIDVLSSTSTKMYDEVGQVKHYLKSGVTKLISTLRDDELPKVIKLDPNKYLIATSVDLSVFNQEEILKIFDPYIKSLQDIYGKKELNRLISSYPKVLDKHFKLWFSDTQILSKILNSNLDFRSINFKENEIKNRIAIFIETPQFEKAREILKKNRSLILTGEPGVGKTTLAEMLSLDYIKDDYDFIHVYDSIRDVDNFLKSDDSKQLIYFDDFLGSNKVEINKSRADDTFLNQIVRRINNYKNKYLILTTRKHILKKALLESEKLNRFVKKSNELVIDLNDLSIENKIKMYENHIELSNIDIHYKKKLLSPALFDFVTNHNFFFPRSIEYITSAEVLKDVKIEEIDRFIRESFNNPQEIWKFAYENQISEKERILLNTLLTFGKEAHLEKLEKAFNKRIKYEVENNNKSSEINDFYRTYNSLHGGFLLEDKQQKVRFINPSLIDFLIKYLKKDNLEVNRIASSISHVDQLTKRLFRLSQSSVKAEMPEVLKSNLLNSYEDFLSEKPNNNEEIRLALVIYKYIKTDAARDIVISILENISDWDSLQSDYEFSNQFREFMFEVTGDYELNSIINESIEEILNNMVTADYDFDQSYETLNSFILQYNIDLSSFNTSLLNQHFSSIIQEYIDDEIHTLRDSIYDSGQADAVKENSEKMKSDLEKLGLEMEIDLSGYFEVDWDEYILDMYFIDQMRKDD